MPDSVRISERETIAAGPAVVVASVEPLPERFGRYRLLGKLGAGGFGIVYKARDEELRRDVAIKVPHRHRFASPEQIELYLTEARILASLDHAGIVPVHDIGRTDDGLCYVVSKFVEGCDLRGRIRQGPLPVATAVEIVARVAEALDHAHRRGLVHRDVKPGNLLLDAAGRPYVTDFGLALREEDFGTGPICAGTPGYMSPEQARGEGHLVDARSDVYSLGVVLYELLVGHVPFVGKSRGEVLERTCTQEPRPPRQLNPQVPRALDRICLKALAARAADRYSTAADLAEDLAHWQGEQSASRVDSAASAVLASTVSVEAPAAPNRSGDRFLKVVPRGLRSFDAADADFFLELLPGPRDRHGLPEGLRFWKTRIEQTDPDHTFRVGLIYGPSGCGKSSFVKAGLLPQLADHVIPCYIEATPADTEAQLLRALHKKCPGLPGELNLVETIAYLRRARPGAPGKKVLIVLDQFEQWLHDWRADEPTTLVQALRQCDGQHVQAIAMVRDDFWMAATRFMRALEIRLVEGQNSAAVDLFDLRHARKVLALFGRAFGALPEGPASPEQEQFLEQSVAGLAQEGKVISVRLSLFAEMVKGQPWTPATLSAVGGAEGIGVAFLEEAFSAPTAPPQHRLHQQAARGVLRALLPEPGAAIKGHRRSRQELLAASGYDGPPHDFEELLEVLDAELRLVTPSDPESVDASTVASGERPYQLTHDYLVQPLRDWLTRKQRETWRGRAALRLAERTALWKPTRQSRFLPTLPEYATFAVGVPRRARQHDEQALMRAARKRHSQVWGGLALLLLLAGVALQQYLSAENRTTEDRRAEIGVDRLLNAAPADVPSAIHALLQSEERALPRLRASFASHADGSTQKLHAAFALATFGEAEMEFLLDAIPIAASREAENLITALSHARESAVLKLWQRVQDEKDPGRRARYAITQLHLGDPRAAELVLAHAPDPKYRTAFIHGFEQWHGEIGGLVAVLEQNQNAAFRSGVSAALGLVDATSLGADVRKSLANVLAEWYRHAPDGGTHSAAGWALRQWKTELSAIESTQEVLPGRDWFVNRLGMTMVRVVGVSHDQGSSSAPLFIADQEVSVSLFTKFIEDSEYPTTEKPQGWIDKRDGNRLRSEWASSFVSWLDAILFCNWLSLREARQPCYRRIDLPRDENRPNWHCDFQANGYRLPTADEWEVACRAGTTTDYSFGNEVELLHCYGIHVANSNAHPWPGGMKLPNSWGVFDMHGNLSEWCWNATGEVREGGVPTREVRGGHYVELFATRLRSSNRRDSGVINDRHPLFGFRVLTGPVDAAAELQP